MDEVLDRHGDLLVHHLHRGGNDAGSDDPAHGVCRVGHRREGQQQRPHRRRILREADGDLGGDTERALTADERPAQIEARLVRSDVAEGHAFAGDQHDLDGGDMGVGDPVGKAMRAARVVRDVAADGADLLARRVRGEVESERAEMFAQVEIDDARLDPCDAVLGVDLENSVHLRHRDHDRSAERNGTAGKAGSGPSGDHGPVVASRHLHHGLDLSRRFGEHDRPGDATVEHRGVVTEQRSLGAVVANAIGGEGGPKICHQRVGRVGRSGVAGRDRSKRLEAFDERCHGDPLVDGGPALGIARDRPPDRGKPRTAHAFERGIVDDGDRHRDAVELVGHDGAERHDLVRLVEHDGGRGGSDANGLGNDTAGRTRTAPRWHHDDPTGQDRPGLGMMTVDHGTGVRVEAAPETEGLVEPEDCAGGLATNQPAHAAIVGPRVVGRLTVDLDHTPPPITPRPQPRPRPQPEAPTPGNGGHKPRVCDPQNRG